MSSTVEPTPTGRACAECRLRFAGSRQLHRHVVSDHRPAPDGAWLIEALLSAPPRSPGHPPAPVGASGVPRAGAPGAEPGNPAPAGAAPPTSVGGRADRFSQLRPSASASLRSTAALLLLGWVLHGLGIAWTTLLHTVAVLALLTGTAVLLFWMHTSAGRGPQGPPADRS